VAANEFSQSVSVLLGNGNGTFQNPVNYDTGGTNDPWGVTLTDVNRDGILDVVTSNLLGSVSLLQGNGDGTFQPAALFAKAGTEYSIAAADFSGDGYPDLVTTASDGVDVLHNDGHWPATRAGAQRAGTRHALVGPWLPPAGDASEPSPAHGVAVETPSSPMPVSWALGHPDEGNEVVSVPTEDRLSHARGKAAGITRTPHTLRHGATPQEAGRDTLDSLDMAVASV
jgi:hypothetical protein